MPLAILFGFLLVFIAGWFLSSSWNALPMGDIATTTSGMATTSASDLPTTPAAVTPGKATAPSAAAPKASAAAYKSVIAQKGSHRCDYEQVSQKQRTTGVVYVSNGKLHAELRASGETITANTIAVYDGRYLYTWTEGQASGSRTQPSSVSQLPLVLPNDLNSSTILGSSENSISWNCRAWAADTKLFAPPSYVAFR